MSLQGLEIVHALPGRVRIKVARLRGDPKLAEEARTKLAKVPGILNIETNVLTGSVLILFDPERLGSLESLAKLTEVVGQLVPDMERSRLSEWLAAVARGSLKTGGNPGSLDCAPGEVGLLSKGLGLNILIPLVLFFLGVRSLLLTEKPAFPAWYDYFWFAFSTLAILNRKWLEEPSTPDTHG